MVSSSAPEFPLLFSVSSVVKGVFPERSKPINAKNERRMRDVGLLLLRFALGGMFAVVLGWRHITGGPERWHGLGGAMSAIGISFWPAFWGFCGAAVEFFGGILIVLGLFFRPACGLIAFVMFVAALSHASLARAQSAVEFCIVAVALLLIGPGNWALGRYLHWRKRKDRPTRT